MCDSLVIVLTGFGGVEILGAEISHVDFWISWMSESAIVMDAPVER